LALWLEDERERPKATRRPHFFANDRRPAVPRACPW